MLYEFLGKPEISDAAFNYLVSDVDIEDNETRGMTPNQLRELESEFYTFLGWGGSKWGNLDAGIKNGAWDDEGFRDGHHFSLLWQEMVPPDDSLRHYRPMVEYAIKIDFKKDPWPDQFYEDVLRWFGDGGDSGTESRMKAARDFLEKLFEHTFRESRYLGAKFYAKKRVGAFVKRTVDGQRELVILLKFHVEGPAGNIFDEVKWSKQFLREIRRHFRIPILKSDIGDPVKNGLIKELQKAYPKSKLTNSPDSEFVGMISEGKKIKISIIK
jgi:hypothetical protein